ncbi:hypothetical protein [Ornithinimicrobium sp. INDO-MA30-4]|nr:hypothetical protein [Ornithinimicrobium sp. INDO-MA30-4]
MLSFRFITAPIVTSTRLSLFAYLERIGGDLLSGCTTAPTC